MYDPVLNRPMFQGPSATAPAATPAVAKGTGITSMVTSPEATAQQLKSFANPVTPAVGFADGGFAITGPTADQNAFSAYNAFLNNRQGLADNAVRTDTKMGAGTPMDAGAASALMNNYTASLQTSPAAVGKSVSPLSQSEARANLAAQKTPSLGSGDSYDIFKSGIVPTQASSGSPSISGKGVIIQTYANGGPVQHFQQGGEASGNSLVSTMWDKFLGSITTKNPTMATGKYTLPDVGLRIGRAGEAGVTTDPREPIDLGSRDAVISPEVYNKLVSPTPEERRAEAQRNINSYEPPPPSSSPIGRRLQSLFGQDAEGVAEAKRRAQEVSDAALARDEALRRREALRTQYEEATRSNPVGISDYFGDISDEELARRQGARREAEAAVMRQARPEDYVASGDSNPMNLGGRGLASLPPMPGPGIKTDTVVNPGAGGGGSSATGGSISTQLAQIKAERNAQTAADRRENALMALMSAGFGMAAGKSRHALTNIAEGGQQGIATFAALERARREDEHRRYLSDLQQRQLELHERELKAKEPLYAAQTEAQRSLPAYRAQIAATREDLARQRAIEQAAKEYDNLVKNGISDEAMRIRADKTGTVAAAIKQDLLRKHFQLEMKREQVQQYDSQNLRPSTTSE